jgi:hypothetical protein
MANDKNIPWPVACARQALDILRGEDAGLAAALEKILPAYAMQKAKSGTEISVDNILEAARQGVDFFANQPSGHAPTRKRFEDVYAGRLQQAAFSGEDKGFEFSKACEAGDLEKVKDIFLDKSSPLSCEEKERGFIRAAGRGQLPVVQWLYARDGAAIEDRTEAYRFSVEKGHFPVVKWLHAQGCRHPQEIFTAVGKGHLPVVKWLCEQGGDIQKNAEALCQAAAEGGHLPMLKWLHQQGVSIAAFEKIDVLRVAKGGHLPVIQWLQDQGLRIADYISDCDGDRESVYAHTSQIQMGMFAWLYDAGIFKNIKPDQREEVSAWHEAVTAWQNVHGVPCPDIIWRHNPHHYHADVFQTIAKTLDGEEYYKILAYEMAFPAAAFLQTEDRLVQYFSKWAQFGQQPLHDIVQMISLPAGKGRFNAADWGDAIVACGPAMARLAKFADKLPSPMKSSDGKSWSAANTRAAVAMFAFNDAAKCPRLAGVCMELAVDEEAFSKALKLVLKKTPATKNIPDVTIDGSRFGMEGATLRRLAANDVRGLFLGEIVNCCQSIGGFGEKCAQHGYTSQDGGFYVVETAKGEIIGEAWAWRGQKDEMCLDSLETLKNRVTDRQWALALKELAREIGGQVRGIYVGTGGGTPESLSQAFKEVRSPQPKDYKGYRDSKGGCFRIG